jgi:hypothetical protein
MMNRGELARIARAMMTKNKGILAADESTSTITKRFAAIKIESTEAHRRSYREMLFTAAGVAEWISGVILYDETLRQKTRDGVPFPTFLEKNGILPGIKVDTGAKPFAQFAGETITEGLDGLRERLIEYRKLGARFAKWRAVIDIGENLPSAFAIKANAHALARYAALCQEQDIVPIVEPEVLMDGAHSIARCEEVTDKVLQTVFGAETQHGDFRQESSFSGDTRTGRPGDAALSETPRAPGGRRHCVSLRRAVAERGDPASGAHEQNGPSAVAPDLQLRSRTAGQRLERLERQQRQCWRGPKGIAAPCETQRTRSNRRLRASHGKSGGLMRHCAAIA